MSREDLFLILTRRDASPLRTKLGPVYSHFCLTSLKAPVCVCVSVCESTSTCLIRFAFLVTELHIVSPTLLVFFAVFFFLLICRSTHSSFLRFFCVFLFSPIARVNLFATGSIARFLRLWTSCD